MSSLLWKRRYLSFIILFCLLLSFCASSVANYYVCIEFKIFVIRRWICMVKIDEKIIPEIKQTHNVEFSLSNFFGIQISFSYSFKTFPQNICVHFLYLLFNRYSSSSLLVRTFFVCYQSQDEGSMFSQHAHDHGKNILHKFS